MFLTILALLFSGLGMFDVNLPDGKGGEITIARVLDRRQCIDTELLPLWQSGQPEVYFCRIK